MKNNFVLGICYCPPDQNAEGDFEMGKEIREVAKGKGAELMGNFNYPYIM